MTLIKELRLELQVNADEKIRESSQRFFKENEEIHCYGMKTATVGQIAKKYLKLANGKSKTEMFDLCEELWKSGYMEEIGIACEWAYALRKQYEQSDFKVFEHWVKTYVSNWATCDTLCNHTIGDFVMMYPKYVSSVKKWAASENRWVKRASAVTFIIPARKGLFKSDIVEIADILLTDRDDMVQKGYGWMLKALSESNQQDVFEYVMRNKAVMPRTALRYAIEKMPKELKDKAMMKP